MCVCMYVCSRRWLGLAVSVPYRKQEGWREAVKTERKESAGHFSGAEKDDISLSYTGWKSGDSGMGSATQHKCISVHTASEKPKANVTKSADTGDSFQQHRESGIIFNQLVWGIREGAVAIETNNALERT